MAYRILHCLARMNRGGAETLIMNIFRHIDREKYEFCFLLNDENCDYAEEIKQLGGYIYSVPSRSSGYMLYCKLLNRFFKEHKGRFDAIHVHTSSLSSLEVFYYAKKHGIKKRIIHSHSTAQKGFIHNILHWFNKPFVTCLATDYLACSKVAGEWLYKYSAAFDKYRIINNGIDLKTFSYNEKAREEIRGYYNIPSDSIIIGHVGRFDKFKNQSFLVDVFEQYHKINASSYLIMIGIGEMQKQIEELVIRKGISSNVVFAGLQTEVYKYLSAFDLFVFPSIFEGLPVALVEAQASGLMTICSDKVSPEACLSDYLSQFELEKTPEEWAEYLGNLPLLDRHKYVYQLEENGYNINKTIHYLTKYIYI